jgi:hypothetical protein
MGRYKAKTGAGSSEEESTSWVGALSQVLDKIGLSTQAEPELALMGPEIEVEVTDSITGVQIAISTIGLRTEADPAPVDDDSTEVLDPPSAGKVAIFAQRETDGRAALDRLVAQAAQIEMSASIYAACELGLDILLASIPAESASVLLRGDECLRFVAARGPRAEALVGTVMPEDEGIAGLVVKQSKGFVVREATQNQAHYRQVDRQVEYHTRTILAVPMIDDGQVLGVVELLNPFGSVDFAEWHQRAAVRVARQLAKRIRVSETSLG